MKLLDDSERARYRRHLLLPELGEEGQLRLKNGSVLIIGAGGLGSPIALYLAAAGVGRIGIADADRVDVSNLQRQVAHSTADVGRLKVESASESMTAINPNVTVEAISEMITPDNIDHVIDSYDFVIDATDSLDAKFFIDRACVKAGKPYNHGAIWRYEGQCMTVLPGTASFSSLFPEGPEAVAKDDVAGPLGTVPGILGCIQASEAIKYLAGIGRLLTDRMLRFDILTMRFDEINLSGQ